MSTPPWILIGILILLLLLLVVFLLFKRGKKVKPDYYTFFIMGLIWFGAGLPLKNYTLFAMGLVFMVVGLVNKDKWQANRQHWGDLDQQEKTIRMVLVIVLGLLVLLGLVFYFLADQGILYN